MTESKLDQRLLMSLERYRHILCQLGKDLDKNDFTALSEHMKYGKSVSAMIESCCRTRKALQHSQKDKKDELKNKKYDITFSSIRTQIGILIDELKKKMQANLEARKSLGPALKIKSAFSGDNRPVFIDIKS